MMNRFGTPALAAYRLGLLTRLALLAGDPLSAILGGEDAPCRMPAALESIRDAVRRLSADIPAGTCVELSALVERETARSRAVYDAYYRWAGAGQPAYSEVLDLAAGGTQFEGVAWLTDIGCEGLLWRHWWRLGICLGDCVASISATPFSEASVRGTLVELVSTVRQLPAEQASRISALHEINTTLVDQPGLGEGEVIRQLAARPGTWVYPLLILAGDGTAADPDGPPTHCQVVAILEDVTDFLGRMNADVERALAAPGLEWSMPLATEPAAQAAVIAASPTMTQTAKLDFRRDNGELTYNGRLIRRVAAQAKYQRMILEAFQDDRWLPRIDDPVPPAPNKVQRTRLAEYLKTMNSWARPAGLLFTIDLRGEGICWREINP